MRPSTGMRSVGSAPAPFVLKRTPSGSESARRRNHGDPAGVRRIDGPGLVDGDGKKWHFGFQGKTDEAVERLLRDWLEHGRVD